MSKPRKPIPSDGRGPSPKWVLDLFAGAGGASLGFCQAGYQPIGAVEIDAGAAETYSSNLQAPVFQMDIHNLNPSDLRRELRIERGELEVLISCPPCQGFSTLRNRSGAADPRNDLLLKVVDFADEFQPRHLFVENVPGLLKTDHGATIYNRLRDQLGEMGYGVHARELNAADYGVPQLRKRVIVLAGRDGGLPPFPWETHGSPTSPAVLLNFRQAWRTVRDAISSYASVAANRSGPQVANHESANLGARVLQFISAVPKDGGSRTEVPEELWLECHLGHHGHTDVYGRLAWDSPANTITTGCTNPSKGRFTHPELDRGITIREAAALQGFPDTFAFSGSNLGRQVGNAVPPPLARAFAEALIESDKIASKVA